MMVTNKINLQDNIESAIQKVRELRRVTKGRINKHFKIAEHHLNEAIKEL